MSIGVVVNLEDASIYGHRILNLNGGMVYPEAKSNNGMHPTPRHGASHVVERGGGVPGVRQLAESRDRKQLSPMIIYDNKSVNGREEWRGFGLTMT